MFLSHEDENNIHNLFSIVNQIYYYYCKLIKLEKYNEINSDKFNIILNKVKTMENDENNLILALSTDLQKTVFIMDTIEQKMGIINPYISNRILNKLEKKLTKTIYNTLDRNKYFDQLKLNDFIPKIINSAIIDDICDIARYYLNQEIKNNSDDYIVSQLINIKYKELFLKLNNIEELITYINTNEILLKFDLIYDFIKHKEKCNYNENEKKLEKSLLIQDKLFSFAEELLNKDDNTINNLDEKANNIVLINYIKSCLCMLDDEAKNSIISFLSSQDKNTEAEKMLISSFKEIDKPKIKTVHFIIK